MDSEFRKLIFQVIDQTISDQDFAKLQDAMEDSEEVRKEYLEAVRLTETLKKIADDEALGFGENAKTLEGKPSRLDQLNVDSSIKRMRRRFQQLVVAAALLIAVGGLAFWLGRLNVKEDLDRTAEQPGIEQETQIAGHATLRSVVDLKWSSDAIPHRVGDVLPNGAFAFESGVVEIDFFCGATLIVEGPALLDIESDWSVKVSRGRLRANVPPAARGFVVKAAGSEIVDLGTEFALQVGSENARIQVIDGEVELRGGEHDGKHLFTGQGQSLKGELLQPDFIAGLSTDADLKRRKKMAESNRLADWQASSEKLKADDRLIAYYPIVATRSGRRVNDAISGVESDGLVVGPVERRAGRFGDASSGLHFGRPGARVRTRIEGEFDAFTFCCWVKIDNLDHRYNALFMGDGYENGEPHWQIRDDGRLMFSVMVDDSQEIRHFSDIDQKMVVQAGLHRVYYSEPFWDISMSGQWIHLAAVYDPNSRKVNQFVNGEQVSSSDIVDKFYISKLRIGPAEIGNWGQPFRSTPWFAVRNLNGTIDELAIFATPLKANEISELYQQGKPLGY